MKWALHATRENPLDFHSRRSSFVPDSWHVNGFLIFKSLVRPEALAKPTPTITTTTTPLLHLDHPNLWLSHSNFRLACEEHTTASNYTRPVLRRQHERTSPGRRAIAIDATRSSPGRSTLSPVSRRRAPASRCCCACYATAHVVPWQCLPQCRRCAECVVCPFPTEVGYQVC